MQGNQAMRLPVFSATALVCVKQDDLTTYTLMLLLLTATEEPFDIKHSLSGNNINNKCNDAHKQTKNSFCCFNSEKG